ncbi:MAG: Uma2 family endonuclease [bacterium]|nr:Uma2 family endonuclease [bacterium]
MTDTQEKTLLTGDDVLNMPESLTSGMELIEGVLVPRNGGESAVPTGLRHAKVESRFARHIGNFTEQHQLGEVYTGEPGFYTRGDTHTFRAPDVAFISYERLPKGTEEEGFSFIPPDLVIEVISPGNRTEKMEEKVREWFAFGVRMVWVAYPSSRRVHVFTAPDQLKIYEGDQRIEGGDVLPGFSATTSDFFA